MQTKTRSNRGIWIIVGSSVSAIVLAILQMDGVFGRASILATQPAPAVPAPSK